MRTSPDSRRGAFIRLKPNGRQRLQTLVTLNNFERIARPRAGDASFQGVTYQLSTVA